MIAVHFGYSGDVDVSAWPLDPMGLVGDVPFMLGRQVALGGVEEQPQSHIHWARPDMACCAMSRSIRQ